jgi:hypothetical protein
MLLTEGFLGWLSRFKLIRLRRISLATLRMDGLRDGLRDGQRDGCQYMYCLPPAGGRIHSQGNYYCLPPVGVLHSQNKVIKCAAYGVDFREAGSERACGARANHNHLGRKPQRHLGMSRGDGRGASNRTC